MVRPVLTSYLFHLSQYVLNVVQYQSRGSAESGFSMRPSLWKLFSLWENSQAAVSTTAEDDDNIPTKIMTHIDLNIVGSNLHATASSVVTGTGLCCICLGHGVFLLIYS